MPYRSNTLCLKLLPLPRKKGLRSLTAASNLVLLQGFSVRILRHIPPSLSSTFKEQREKKKSPDLKAGAAAVAVNHFTAHARDSSLSLIACHRFLTLRLYWFLLCIHFQLCFQQPLLFWNVLDKIKWTWLLLLIENTLFLKRTWV